MSKKEDEFRAKIIERPSADKKASTADTKSKPDVNTPAEPLKKDAKENTGKKPDTIDKPSQESGKSEPLAEKALTVTETDKSTSLSAQLSQEEEQLQARKEVIVKEAREIAADTLLKALQLLERFKELIGFLLIQRCYEGLIEGILSGKRPPKLLKEVIADPAFPIRERRRAMDCVYGAATKKDLTDSDEDTTNLSFSHFPELFRVKNREERHRLAREANAERLTVDQLRERIRALKGQPVGEVGKKILKKMGNPSELLEDEDIRTLLTNRNQLQLDLSKAEKKELQKRVEDWDYLYGVLRQNLEPVAQPDSSTWKKMEKMDAQDQSRKQAEKTMVE